MPRIQGIFKDKTTRIDCIKEIGIAAFKKGNQPSETENPLKKNLFSNGEAAPNYCASKPEGVLFTK